MVTGGSTFSTSSANVGGPAFQGGELVFSTLIPFTQLTLTALDGSAAATAFGIDNLTLAEATPVPEPASMLLLGTGLIGLAARRRRNRR